MSSKASWLTTTSSVRDLVPHSHSTDPTSEDAHALSYADIITDDLSTIDPNLIISRSGVRKHSQLKILSLTQADNLLRGTCRTYPEACEEVGDGQSISVDLNVSE